MIETPEGPENICQEHKAPPARPDRLRYCEGENERRRSSSSHHVDCISVERAPVRVLGVVHQDLGLEGASKGALLESLAWKRTRCYLPVQNSTLMDVVK